MHLLDALNSTTLNVAEAAECLRKWGLAALGHLLKNAPRPAFSDQDWEILFPYARCAAPGREAISLASLDSVALFFPKNLWRLLGRAAWEDAGFRMETAKLLRSFLGTRYLFRMGEMPAVSLDGKLFWALMAFFPPSPAVSPELCRESLLNAACSETLLPNWAGFWEQWLIARAFSLKSDEQAKIPDQLEKSLKNLPILKNNDELGLNFPSQEDGGQTILSAADWLSEKPSWIEISQHKHLHSTPAENCSKT